MLLEVSKKIYTVFKVNGIIVVRILGKKKNRVLLFLTDIVSFNFVFFSLSQNITKEKRLLNITKTEPTNYFK